MRSGFSPLRGSMALAVPSLFAAAGMVMTFYPTLFSGFARIQNDSGDTRHLNYVLEHGYRWLARAPIDRDLWSPPIFYPEPNTAAYTELLLGVVPFYVPWRLMRFDPDTAFQLWMLAISVLNFAAMYWFLRRGFAFSVLASSFGSFLFAFGSPRINQLNHQFLLPQFFTVLALYFAGEVFRLHRAAPDDRRCGPCVIAFFASVAAQIYASYYHGWFLSFALAIAFLGALAIASVRREVLSVLRAHAAAIAIGLALCAAVLAPLALHHLAAAKAVGFRPFWQAEGLLPRFQSWFYMGAENWLYGWTAKHDPFIYLPMEWEQRLGLGVLTTVVVVWSLFRERHRPAIRIMILTWRDAGDHSGSDRSGILRGLSPTRVQALDRAGGGPVLPGRAGAAFGLLREAADSQRNCGNLRRHSTRLPVLLLLLRRR